MYAVAEKTQNAGKVQGDHQASSYGTIHSIRHMCMEASRSLMMGKLETTILQF
jgi:hypothetical protein